MPSVPFFLSADRAAELGSLLSAMERAASNDSLILGPEVGAFEASVAQRLRRHAIAVGSGTDALKIALRCCDVAPGDDVIVPAYGCQPIASSVLAVGARPVFVDVDPDTLTLDPSRIVRAVTKSTSAIIVAHIFSTMADAEAVCALGRDLGVRVVEDACVQFGGVQNGHVAGTFGHVATFSFAPVKAFGACGDGGMVLTNDTGAAIRARALRNHGQDGKHRYRHHLVGYNSRMDDIVASFLLSQLQRLPDTMMRRNQIASFYCDVLGPLAPRFAIPRRRSTCTYLFVSQAESRDMLVEHLQTNGIDARTYYPVPLPLQEAFSRFVPASALFPVALQASQKNIALPCGPGLSDAQVEHVAESVVRFYRGRKGR